MLQVIDRADGAFATKRAWRGNVQVSYNDWGHLAIRLIRPDGSDTLAVFGRAASERIIKFIKDSVQAPCNYPRPSDDEPF